jgi:hypothetical protein
MWAPGLWVGKNRRADSREPLPRSRVRSAGFLWAVVLFPGPSLSKDRNLIADSSPVASSSLLVAFHGRETPAPRAGSPSSFTHHYIGRSASDFSRNWEGHRPGPLWGVRSIDANRVPSAPTGAQTASLPRFSHLVTGLSPPVRKTKACRTLREGGIHISAETIAFRSMLVQDSAAAGSGRGDGVEVGIPGCARRSLSAGRMFLEEVRRGS